MAEASFPIVEQPLSDQQWGQVTLGFGSGILASSPTGNYQLTGLDNALNQGTLSTGSGIAQAVVGGFYHRIDADHVVSLPAVTATTTYYIGLTYDPTKHAFAGGPVSITVTTTVPSGQGKVYLPLYEVVRAADQLLTAATVRERRVYVSPTLTVAARANLPETTGLLTGTLATDLETGTVWRVDGAQWSPANAPWIVPFGSNSQWAIDSFMGGVEVKYLANKRKLCRIDARMRRTGTTFTQGTDWTNNGVLLPTSLRDGGDFWWYTGGFLAGSPGEIRVNVSTGQIEARLVAGTKTVSAGTAWSIQMSWTTW